MEEEAAEEARERIRAVNGRSEDLLIDTGYIMAGFSLIVLGAILTMNHHGWLPVISAIINVTVATRLIDKGVFRIRRAHREARKEEK